MITNWYEKTVTEIYFILKTCGYAPILDGERTSCRCIIGDDLVAYFARSPSDVIDKFGIYDDEKQYWNVINKRRSDKERKF